MKTLLKKSQISYIDGVRLRWAIMGATEKLREEENKINELNYFPVPDKDTGSNMAATFKNIMEDLQDFHHPSLTVVANKIAESALEGARGNSGGIIAQFLCGLSEGVEGHQQMNLSQFVNALACAHQRAREVLLEPVEGTIISVMRDWPQFCTSLQAGGEHDFYSLFLQSLPLAQKSLQQTAEGPTVGKFQTGIDAGAQGFVCLLEGIQKILTESKTTGKAHLRRWEMAKLYSLTDDSNQRESENYHAHDEMGHFAGTEEDIEFRYCTECLLLPLSSSGTLNRLELQQNLRRYGDSLIVAGGKNKIRLHIHTSNPEEVFTHLRTISSITHEKVDDMLQQFRNNQISQKAKDKAAIIPPALIVDTSCDLPSNLMDRYNIHQVPTRVLFGEENYMDKITLNSNSFYKKLLTSPHHPKTSCPTPGDFTRCYQMVMKSYRQAISLHIPQALSSTFQQAKNCAQKISPHIQVLDSSSASVGLGLLALEIARAIDQGKSYEEVIEHFQKTQKNLKVFLVLNTLEFLAKGGRIHKVKGMIGNIMQLKPILAITAPGQIEVVTQAVGIKAAKKKIYTLIDQHLENNGQSPLQFAIAHGDAPHWAAEVGHRLKATYPHSNLFTTQISPALGVHAGPGSLCVAMLTDGLSDKILTEENQETH